MDTSGRSVPKTHPAAEGFAAVLKRTVDLVVALGAGLALAPILAGIAIAIAVVDGRPVLYSQIRTGLNGRRFRIFKFRTMRAGAEAPPTPVWAVTNDPRSTRLGARLRRLGLDELPQLWNVLRGEMSLVGPRPERPEFADRFELDYPGYKDRQRVPPGITGYAQVHGWRGDTDLGERLRHDLYYIRHWSLVLDLRVLLATARHGWSERTRSGLPG